MSENKTSYSIIVLSRVLQDLIKEEARIKSCSQGNPNQENCDALKLIKERYSVIAKDIEYLEQKNDLLNNN